MAERLHVETFVLGEWATNCFVLHRANAAAGSACWIVDAGFNPDELIDYIRRNQLAPREVLLTHAHLDHIAGLHAIRAAWPSAAILIHRAEECFLTEPMLNLSVILDEPIVAPPATGFLEAGQTLSLDGLELEVRHTPGHSPGGISLYHRAGNCVIAGDSLFNGSIGRTDFPTSDHDTLIRSIREQLLTLPDDTVVHPGHGDTTTIGREKRGNPFVGEFNR
jgi:glyoxylase-like metal-dependent hydrolase (beta-lactamase superfamily II)